MNPAAAPSSSTWSFPTFLPDDLPAPAAVTPAAFPGGKTEMHVGRIWDEDDPEFARIHAQVGDQVAVERGASLHEAVAAAQELALASDTGTQPQAVLQARSGAYYISPVLAESYAFDDLRSWRAAPATAALVALVDDERWIDFASAG